MTELSHLPQNRMPCVLPGVVEVERAYFIADVAHTARGQTRDDKITPYIRHPERCAALTKTFFHLTDPEKRHVTFGGFAIKRALEIAVAAAYLHDVLEDTRLTKNDLRRYGITEETIVVVDLLTKKNAAHEPENTDYYTQIRANEIALLVKVADRCSNLEDVATNKDGAKRWSQYVERTVSDVLPLARQVWALGYQLEYRIDAARANVAAVARQEHAHRIERLESALAKDLPENVRARIVTELSAARSIEPTS